MQLYEVPLHQLGGMRGPAAPRLPVRPPSRRAGPQQEPLVPTGTMPGMQLRSQFCFTLLRISMTVCVLGHLLTQMK